MRWSCWHLAAVVAGLAGARLLAYALLAAPLPLGEALCQWDCAWYLSIVEHGYDVATRTQNGLQRANWAFFPLYPMLVRGLGLPFGGDPRTLAVIVSTVAGIAFALLGARYRRLTRGETSPWPWILLVAAWPFGFYFHVAYAEALYAALATAALLALAAGRPLRAGIAGALLCATRPTGILIAAWIGLARLYHLRDARTLSGGLRILLPAAIAPLGLVAFAAFLWVHLGDPLAFQRIQAGWSRESANPLSVLAIHLAYAVAAGPGNLASYLLAWALLGLAAAPWLLVRRRFAEAWLCGATVLMASASGNLFSMPRFVAANPAFLFVVADIVAAIRWPALRYAVLAAFAGLQLVLLRHWYLKAIFLA